MLHPGQRVRVIASNEYPRDIGRLGEVLEFFEDGLSVAYLVDLGNYEDKWFLDTELTDRIEDWDHGDHQ